MDDQIKDQVVNYMSPKSVIPRRRRIKYCGIIISGVVVQVVILGVLALTVFRFRDPNIHLASVTVESLTTSSSSSSNDEHPNDVVSYNLTLREQIVVRNRNWGDFRYDKNHVVLSRGSVAIQEAGEIPSGRVKMRSTRRVWVLLQAKFDRDSSGDVSNMTVLGLRSYLELTGKVSMLRMVRKRRTGVMDCKLTVNLARQTVQEFRCQ